MAQGYGRRASIDLRLPTGYSWFGAGRTFSLAIGVRHFDVPCPTLAICQPFAGTSKSQTP